MRGHIVYVDSGAMAGAIHKKYSERGKYAGFIESGVAFASRECGAGIY